MQALFDQVADAKLTINLAKCEFAKVMVIYLGRVVWQGLVANVTAKVATIEDHLPSTTKKELQRVWGLESYYRGLFYFIDLLIYIALSTII